MGIYDREYYRGESSGPNWFGGVAPWCKTLIVINVVVYLFQNLLHMDHPLFVNYLEASPRGIFHQGFIWQLWTATFLHASPWHLLGNMWFLWLVGCEMESLYGSRDFLAFYLLAAGFSTLGWALMVMLRFGDIGWQHHMLGALGAVLAVVTLYTLFYPRREILFFFVPMPMWVLLGIYLVLPLLMKDELVAYEAHLMGAAFAFGFKLFDLRWSRLVTGRFRRPRLRIFTPQPVDQPRIRPSSSTTRASSGEVLASKPSPVTVLPPEQLDARLDEVLAKIAREGRGGLTEDDHRVLQEASRRARDKRSDRL